MKKLIIIILLCMSIPLCFEGQDLYVWYLYFEPKYLGTDTPKTCYPKAPLKIQPTGDWYVLDLENLKSIDVSLSGNDQNLKGFNDERYIFKVTPEALGEQIKPIYADPGIAHMFTTLPWIGDYHIEIAKDLSVAVFTATSPFVRETDDLQWFVKNSSIDKGKSGYFNRTGTYEYTCDFIGDDRIPPDSYFNIYVVPQKIFSSQEIIESGGIYSFTPKGRVLPSNMPNGFEGTVKVSHNGDYFTPMSVEFIPIGTSGIKETGANSSTNRSVRYFNLQGIEVADPHNGIFVEVSDGKSRMVKK